MKALRRFLNRLFASATSRRDEARPREEVEVHLQTRLALALAAVNVAGLAAVRSAARDKEMAIRLAIGARRSRLDRQLLTEGRSRLHRR